MSDKLTNQEAARLARELEGRCRTAARTQAPTDCEAVSSLVTDVLLPSRWSNVDPTAFRDMFMVQEYADKGCYAMAAQEAGRAARILEAKSATRSS